MVSDAIIEDEEAQAWSPARPGDVIGDKYRVDSTLGSGGVGVVLAATHIQLGTRVAIKFLNPDSLRDPVAKERFLREARAMARVESEHVARVLDVDTLATGEPFIVMEKLEGIDLATLLAKRGRLAMVEAVDLAMQICEPLEAAHALGIIHRDLKPSNVFLARDSRGGQVVKVLDFGVAKVIGRDSFAGHLTEAHAVLGSPLYMSPEQMTDSSKVDRRTDIWAMGVLLFELLSGRPPFMAQTLPLVCTLVLHGKQPSMREAGGAIPDELEAVIERCLRKEPDERYASIAELAGVLAPFSSGSSKVPASAAARRTSSRAFRSNLVVASIGTGVALAGLLTVVVVSGRLGARAGSAPGSEPAARSASALTPDSGGTHGVAAPSAPAAALVNSDTPATASAGQAGAPPQPTSVPAPHPKKPVAHRQPAATAPARQDRVDGVAHDDDEIFNPDHTVSLPPSVHTIPSR